MAALVVVPVALAATDRALALAGAAAVVLLLALAALLARTVPLALGLGTAVVLYALSGTGFPAPLAGGLLLLAAELVAWSIDERIPTRPEPGLDAARLRAIAAVTALGTAAGAVVLLADEVGASRSVPLTLLGALAAVGCLALLARQAAARRAT